MRTPFRYSSFQPENIRFTSDCLDFDGLYVQIRDLPDEGEGATGPRGRPYFSFAYRAFPDQGRGTVWFDQAQAPGHPLSTNRIDRIALLLPPDRPHRWSWQNAGGRIAGFGFLPGFAEAVLRRAGLPTRGLWGFPPASFAVNYPVDGLCRLLMDETERGCPRGGPYFEHLGAALVIAIASQTDPRLPDAGDLQAQHRRLQPAIALMKTHFASKLTLGQLARATGVSEFYFNRLFHAAVGLTPCQYLWAYRLHRAQLLLSLTGQVPSIARVAAECGFADQAHLCRRFRVAYGVTPLAFREEKKIASGFKKRASAF
jgi:AraC-like DNA-binding protein